MLHSLNQREHQLRERFGCFFIFMIIIAVGGMAFFHAPNPPKTYSVSLPSSRWQNAIQTLDNAGVVMRKSTLPTNVVSEVMDSLGVLRNEIYGQISAEISAETKKMDSVSKKQR